MSWLRILAVAVVVAAPACTAPPPGSPLLSGAVELSLDGNSCVVLGNGTAKCWGPNGEGQVGNATFVLNEYVQVPVPVTGLSDISDLDVGSRHSCAALEDGTAWCWGEGAYGELGAGPLADSPVPVAVAGLGDVEAISAGGASSCALRQGGVVDCWGDNHRGALGNGTFVSSPVPTSVNVSDVVGVSAGYGHACAVIDDGTVRCWGDNTYGQLGDGNEIDVPPYGSSQPVEVVGVDDVVEVVAGTAHTCALRADGTVVCWGRNSWGQLGRGTFSRSEPLAAPVVGIGGTTQLTGAVNANCALVAGGAIRCWGDNLWGELGNGTSNPAGENLPVDVVGISGALAVSAGAPHTCALLAQGRVKCWGAGYAGVLGDGTLASSLTPVDVLAGF